MRFESLLARALYIVERELRHSFPDDYDARCMYAAFGLRGLFHNSGVAATLVGGDFMAFVASKSLPYGSHQGFAGSENGYSHFWIEVEGSLVDLGPHFLPRKSRFSAAKMPLLAWRLEEEFPAYLRYRPQARFASEVQLDDAAIMERIEKFSARCSAAFRVQKGQPRLPSWILTGPASLAIANKQGDQWARCVLHVLPEMSFDKLPF
jgi:hypothetical protein